MERPRPGRRCTLVPPLLVIPGTALKLGIPGMPGLFRYSPDLLIDAAARLYALGIRTLAIIGSGLPGAGLPGTATVDTALVPALSILRATFPDLRLITHLPRAESDPAFEKLKQMPEFQKIIKH